MLEENQVGPWMRRLFPPGQASVPSHATRSFRPCKGDGLHTTARHFGQIFSGDADTPGKRGIYVLRATTDSVLC